MIEDTLIFKQDRGFVSLYINGRKLATARHEGALLKEYLLIFFTDEMFEFKDVWSKDCSLKVMKDITQKMGLYFQDFGMDNGTMIVIADHDLPYLVPRQPLAV